MGDYEKARKHIAAALDGMQASSDNAAVDDGLLIAWSVDSLTHAVLAVAYALTPRADWP